MEPKVHFKAAVIVGLVIGLPATMSSEASATLCSTSDLTLTIAGANYSPTSCANSVPQGGGPGTEAAGLNTAFGTSFSFAAGTGASSVVFQGLDFAVTAVGGTTGSWTVSWTDTNGSTPLNLPVDIDFIVGLYGGNGGDGYLFDAVLLPAPPNNSGSGTFDIVFQNNGGQNPTISHLDLLVGDPQTPPSGGQTPVPEPGSLALLGTALAGLGAIRQALRHA